MKRHKLHYLIFCSLLLLQTGMLFGQNQSSNYGKSFALGFMENAATPTALNLYIRSTTTSAVSVTVPVLGQINFVLQSNRDTTIVLPVAQVYNTTSEALLNRAVYITSTEDISVVAMNSAPFSSDAVSLIPINHIPAAPKYIINTYRGTSSFPSSFIIVGIQDNTTVEITPSQETKQSKQANIPFTITLNKGQVYMVQSKDSSNLRGSVVRVINSCQKILVFSGARCSQVSYNAGCSGCDHLWEQSVPTSHWGKSFQSLPMHQNNGYLLSIVASENNTNILISGIGNVTLNANEGRTFSFTTNTIVCINSDLPISVMQLLRSGECNGHPSRLSDPSMFRLIPLNQWVKETSFSIPSTQNLSQQFVSVLCKDPSKVLVNGAPLNSLSLLNNQAGCYGLSVYTFQTNTSALYIHSDSAFYAYAYAYGNAESYVTSPGSAYENTALNFNFDPPNTPICSDKESFNFTIQQVGFSNFKWEFGDGNSAVGLNPSHTYNQSGNYTVLLIASNPNNVCPEDTVRKNIILFPPPIISLHGDTIICKEPEYIIQPKTNLNYSFLWHNGSQAKQFILSQDGKVWLRVTDENNCSNSDTANVIFDPCIEKKIYMPNVFTPGRDGYNDAFSIYVEGFIETECRIFNRWGLELYRFNPASDRPWNGGIQNDPGQPCADGTYYFIFNFTDPDTKESFQKNGTVLLIREK